MAVNWPEIGLIILFQVLVVAGAGLYVKYRTLPRGKREAEQWIGGAIGRFMQSLSEQAAAEEGGEGLPGGGGAGSINLGGFKIDAGTIRSIAEILKVLRDMGLLKGGGGGENPFL